jgi:hypothetical protein
LVLHGDGEGGHYFTTNMAHVWCHMPDIILWYPYGGMDYHQDPYMVLPFGEDWDHRGMLMYFMFCDFDSITYFYVWMDVDAIVCLLCVQMWGHEGDRWSWLECWLVRGP